MPKYVATRTRRPRIVTDRYFSSGPKADAVADEYVHHYYGDEYFAAARNDTMTSPEQVARGGSWRTRRNQVLDLDTKRG